MHVIQLYHRNVLNVSIVGKWMKIIIVSFFNVTFYDFNVDEKCFELSGSNLKGC